MSFHNEVEYILQAINQSTDPAEKEKYLQKLEVILNQYVQENQNRQSQRNIGTHV